MTPYTLRVITDLLISAAVMGTLYHKYGVWAAMMVAIYGLWCYYDGRTRIALIRAEQST